MSLRELVKHTNVNEAYGVETEFDNGDERVIEHFSEVIANILTFSLQAHIYHLQTLSGNDHMALGEFYDTLRNEGDELAEKFIGNGGILNYYDEFDVDFTMTYDKGELINELYEFKEDILTAIRFTDESELLSLQEDLVEIKGAIDSLVYKLRMS